MLGREACGKLPADVRHATSQRRLSGCHLDRPAPAAATHRRPRPPGADSRWWRVDHCKSGGWHRKSRLRGLSRIPMVLRHPAVACVITRTFGYVDLLRRLICGSKSACRTGFMIGRAAGRAGATPAVRGHPEARPRRLPARPPEPDARHPRRRAGSIRQSASPARFLAQSGSSCLAPPR